MKKIVKTTKCYIFPSGFRFSFHFVQTVQCLCNFEIVILMSLNLEACCLDVTQVIVFTLNTPNSNLAFAESQYSN